ncbi:MAG: hypothetical protein JW871_05280 [Endomicrobiales bacterium]|nr:hypothetical protein [Endomicrobiales bacterium]
MRRFFMVCSIAIFVFSTAVFATDFAVFDNHKSIGVKVMKFENPEVSFRKWKDDTRGREFVFGCFGAQFGLSD